MQSNAWLKELGYDIRDDAVKDALTAMNGNWTKMENGTIDKFTLKFRSRKQNKSESLYFRKRWIVQRDNTLVLNWPRRKQPMELFTGRSAWRGDILMDCRLQ